MNAVSILFTSTARRSRPAGSSVQDQGILRPGTARITVPAGDNTTDEVAKAFLNLDAVLDKFIAAGKLAAA
jgi:hypothetical protein